MIADISNADQMIAALLDRAASDHGLNDSRIVYLFLRSYDNDRRFVHTDQCL